MKEKPLKVKGRLAMSWWFQCREMTIGQKSKRRNKLYWLNNLPSMSKIFSTSTGTKAVLATDEAHHWQLGATELPNNLEVITTMGANSGWREQNGVYFDVLLVAGYSNKIAREPITITYSANTLLWREDTGAIVPLDMYEVLLHCYERIDDHIHNNGIVNINGQPLDFPRKDFVSVKDWFARLLLLP